MDEREVGDKDVSSSAKAGKITITAFPPFVQAYAPLPDKHPFYAIVGRVVSEWAHLEHALDMIIWELMGIDRKLGSCVTGQMIGHWPRVNAIMALATAKGVPKDVITDFETFGNRISNPAKRRHRFVHDAWYGDSDGMVGQFLSFSSKDQHFGIRDIDEESALAVIAAIRNKIAELQAIRSRLTAHIPPPQ